MKTDQQSAVERIRFDIENLPNPHAEVIEQRTRLVNEPKTSEPQLLPLYF